ncbi:testis-expressed protein 15 [Rana temporaria]|uniref:testis-expressed protein 15 n=1 Tax=Rana temporaria TaxID=8407 RepID=UPI001AADA7D9|nr:testis-expressed protein 15 [Rana temporaria]
MPYNHFSMSLESLIASSLGISSKCIKDPRLLKRCEQEVVKFTGQYLLGQQNQKELVFESEVPSLKEKEPSKENLGTLENSGSKTSLYVSFEEARFSDENYMNEQEIRNMDEKEDIKSCDQHLTEQQRQSKCVFDNEVSNKDEALIKERESWENIVSKTSLYISFEEVRLSDDSRSMVKESVMKTEKKQSSFVTLAENVEDADDQSLHCLSTKENSKLSGKLCVYGGSQTLRDNQFGLAKDEEPTKLNSSLEKTSAPPGSINKIPAKVNDKNHLLQSKCQVLSSGINKGESKDSGDMSSNQKQKDALLKVVLNASNSNECFSSGKLTEDKSAEVTTQTGTLQNNQYSICDEDKKVCSNGNRSKLATTKPHHIDRGIVQPTKTFLPLSKRQLDKSVQPKTCISNPDMKAKKIVDHTSPQKHLSNSSSCLNTKSPKAAEKRPMKKSLEKKVQKQSLHKKEKSIKIVPAASPKKMKDGDKHNAVSKLTNDLNGKHAFEKHRSFPAPIHEVYKDATENELNSKSSLPCTGLCTTKEDKEVKKNSDSNLICKNVHCNDSFEMSQTEKSSVHKSLTEYNAFGDMQRDLQCLIELESRIDWKGIFGKQNEKAEDITELWKPSRKLREPSGLRIFPDMEITIRNSHYMCVEQDVNNVVEVYSSMTVKENINNSAKKDDPSNPQTSDVSETVANKTSSMSQDYKAPVDNRPELLSHSVRINESVHLDGKLITQNQGKSEAINDNNLTCIKTRKSLSHSNILKKKLSSTRRHSVVIKKSVRNMNKFSQSEKNIKVVLGLLSGEIPLCKNKRISKRLDRAMLHLRKAHKRVQKSLQLEAKSGRKCNVTESLQATGNSGQENHAIKNHNTFKIKSQNGKKMDTKRKQAKSLKVECGGKQLLQSTHSFKVAVIDKHPQRSSEDRKCLNLTTQALTGKYANDSLAATSGNSASPKKLPPSPQYRNSVGIAANSPIASMSEIENAVPAISSPKLTSEKKEVLTKKCLKVKKDIKELLCTKKMLLHAKKYHSCHTKIKTSKKKTDSACEKNQHKGKKVKHSTLTTAKKNEVSRLLLGKLSKILQNASETDSLNSLLDCRSLCKKMLPVFIKSFERKQKCTWRDVIVDRKLLFSNHLNNGFRSTLQPQAVEAFLELQMMIETTEFIENRIRFIEGRPTFRSLLWYDGSLYRELLAGEAGYQQQSHFYTAFQEKLNDSAVTTLESLCSRLSDFLQEIDDKNSSYYVYLKYNRELKECEDVLKHDCDYSAFSLSIPFSCGAHLGDTVEDLVALQKSTLEIISRFIQLPKVEPEKKEHALCLLEMISAKIDFLKTSVSKSMNLSLFGIQHLLFDASKMMVFKERKALDGNKMIVLTNEIIGQINSNALSKLYEVFCVPGEEAWMADDNAELWNKIPDSHKSLSSHNDKFIVSKFIDQALHAKPDLLEQMICECQKHLHSQIKNFQILQECDIEKALIKDSNVKEITQRKDPLTTLIKPEAVEPYIELAMTSETLHFLNCVMASQKKKETKRGLLWYDTSLLSDLVQIQQRLASFVTGTMMPNAVDTIKSRIVDIKSELEVISSCSDSVNYAYAFQMMTRELSELSELKKMVFKLDSAIHEYINFSPWVVSLHYGSLTMELDHNYRQFSDFLGILMSSPKKDLGKMAHTMMIMKTIELAKALNDKNNNLPFDIITCQILQNTIQSNCMVNKTPNEGKTKMLNDQSPRKRKCTSPEAVSPKKKVLYTCEKSPGKEKKEKTESPSR